MAPDLVDPLLDRALAGLVDGGTLTADQAEAVRRARQAAATAAEGPSEGAPEQGAAATQEAARHSPVPEILGYAGAALVLSAVLNVVAQSWEAWSDAVRVTVAAGAAVVLYAAAAVVSGMAGGRSALASGQEEARRRVVAVLIAIGVPVSALATLAAIDLARAGAEWRDTDGIIVGAVAFTVAAIGAWWVRGVMATLAVGAGSVWLAMSIADPLARGSTQWLMPVAVAVSGAAWLALAPRLLAAPELAEALGMGWLVFGIAPTAMEGAEPREFGLPAEVMAAAWVARGLLVALAVIALIRFARGATWPWAAGGIAAGVFAAMSLGQGTLGWIAGLFAAGIVLLALSGLMLALRRRGSPAQRQRPHMRSGDSTPQSPSPLDST